MLLNTRSRSEQLATESTVPSSPESSLSLKERMTQKRKADRLRKEMIRFTTAVVFIAVFVGFLLGFIGGIKAAAAGGIGILVLALSFKYPRYAMWGFFLYVPFGGTITYAIGNSPLLQLAKDGFYLPALIGLAQRCQRERLPILIPKQLTTPLVFLLTSCSFTILFVNGFQQFFGTPGEQPIAMGILGLKVLIGYAPLIICSYYLIRNQKDLLFLVRLTSVLFLVACGLAFVQYLMLLTGVCPGTRFESGSDLFKASLQARCFVGGALLYSPQQGVIRLPGTFVAPWQWGWFLISGAFLTFASAFSDPKPLWRLMGLLSLGAVFVLAVISGQRIALALVPSIAALLLVFTGQVTNLKRFIPIVVGLGIILSAAALKNPETVQERIDSFISRWNASPPYQFIFGQFGWAMQGYNILGHGVGRATNSARALGRTELVETYYPKLLYEIGPIGVLAFLSVVTVLTHVTFKTYRSLRDRNLRSYGASLWLFVLFISYNTYYYPLDVDPVAVYYWFFAGVILKLPEIERLAKLEPQVEEKSKSKGKFNKKKRKQKRKKKR
ncbi:hormogonium polysaccharide biosynthesis protein HpsL [Thermocoleostomius sinensis]|uniref:Hormogonium polysaccharide biosynthesis protein HpsL n=1 Tax=Thermocoleostomius sinensis A174 TaxID=2016057 RepID=A0A9E9C8C8_9CYAN|nr:hormogonium polysaccharide biosynthesis protein HpsL [Thermocoleostomius sinensis]WAL61279.1 hormogonium polysaccharide biosynthesis protein HpsL [Thermocoleostomius sinensis A174]